jgi:hypothetical protein
MGALLSGHVDPSPEASCDGTSIGHQMNARLLKLLAIVRLENLQTRSHFFQRYAGLHPTICASCDVYSRFVASFTTSLEHS